MGLKYRIHVLVRFVDKLSCVISYVQRVDRYGCGKECDARAGHASDFVDVVMIVT